MQTALFKVGDEKIPYAIGTNNSMAAEEPEPQPVPESPDPEEPDPEEPDPEEPDPEQCDALMQEIDAIGQTLEEAKSVADECRARVAELQAQLDVMKQERFEKWMKVGGKAAGGAAKGAISGFPDPRRMVIGGVWGAGRSAAPAASDVSQMSTEIGDLERELATAQEELNRANEEVGPLQAEIDALFEKYQSCGCDS